MESWSLYGHLGYLEASSRATDGDAVFLAAAEFHWIATLCSLVAYATTNKFGSCYTSLEYHESSCKNSCMLASDGGSMRPMPLLDQTVGIKLFGELDF